MKLTYKIIAGLATLSLAVAGAVYAHPGGGYGMGPGMGPGMGYGMGPGMGYGMGPGGSAGSFDLAANAAARTSELKAELKITPAQESAWNAYETAVGQQASAMQAMRSQMQALMQNQQAGAGGTDLRAQWEAMIKLRDASHADRSAALKDLYAALTPEQKAIFDRSASGVGGHWTARNHWAR